MNSESHTGYVSHTDMNEDGLESAVTLSNAVTICLTPLHDECVGEYVDITHFFRLKCHCQCHSNSADVTKNAFQLSIRKHKVLQTGDSPQSTQFAESIQGSDSLNG